MLGQYYQEEEYGAATLPEGDYCAKIVGAKEGTAKTSGNPMAIITLAIKESSIEFKYWIVENEYFNRNMTKFFDCFKIRRGEFDMNRWVGKYGYVHIAKGKPNEHGLSYLEVKSLVIPQGQPPHEERYPAEQKKPYARPAPERKQSNNVMPFPEDIPF